MRSPGLHTRLSLLLVLAALLGGLAHAALSSWAGTWSTAALLGAAGLLLLALFGLAGLMLAPLRRLLRARELGLPEGDLSTLEGDVR